jgi:N-acetylglucosaminyldiphosphoundecaprenol N-acetyl-beta-D-mannosaminyltransferase
MIAFPQPDRRGEQNRYDVGPLSFSAMTLEQAVELVRAWGASRPDRGRAVHFANAYNVALASKDAEYASLINSGDLVCSDGTPVVWAGRWLHGQAQGEWDRVYGPDVFERVLAAGQGSGIRHYLLGGSEETLGRLHERICSEWPAAVVVGAESPPFRPATSTELAERDTRILESGATLVWVGLGTPKQDYEVRRLADSIPVTALAVGAAFDFLAGTVKQAPVWMQRSGMEWAYRFSKEPKRLAGRYLWGNPVFVGEVIRQRLER